MLEVLEPEKFAFPSELVAAECVVDIFADAVQNGITTISTREILYFLGVKLDNYENIVYDLAMFTRKDIAFLTDAILERFKPEAA